jgi:hypothetical protein
MKKYLMLALLPLAACHKSKDNDKKDDQVLMPLAIGNQWLFDHKVYDQNGSVIDNYPQQPIVVLKEGTKPGYYSIEADDSEQLFSSPTEIDGYTTDDLAWKFLKSDKIDTFSRATDSYGNKVVSVAYPGTSQVLTYNNCYKNEYFNYDPNGDLYGKDVYYVSPGTGIVRSEYYEANGNGGWQLEYREDLQSYTIK